MKWFSKASLSSRSARYHIGVAAALITIIPSLVLLHLSLREGATVHEQVHRYLPVALVLILSVVSGYVLLSKYPANIMRLREYLENMVNGHLPEKVELLEGMDDIAAIERSLNLIVEQLSLRVQSMERERTRIEWLLTRDADPRNEKDIRAYRDKLPSTPVAEASPERLLLDAVGEEVLGDLVGDFLDLVETWAMVFERDGNLSLDVVVSRWARCLDEAARRRAGTGNASTRERFPAWSEACTMCMREREPVDIEGDDGLRIYCAPVWMGEEVVGAMGFAYGDPPSETPRLRAVAERYGIDVNDLRAAAQAYETRPNYIVSLARNRLLTCAKLVGEIIERRQAETVVRRSEEELREHRDHLEELVEERTGELTEANRRLKNEIEQRRRAEQLKDEFVSTVSHELRTPLAITKEGVGLLLDGIPGPVTDKQRKVLTTSRNNIDRLARIINDLLDISKIEAGKMDLHKVRVDLAGIVAQALASVEALASRKGLKLQASSSGEGLNVYADADRVMQVLTNLLGNAIKFTTEGSIRVSCRRENGDIRCSVADTGVGMSEEDSRRVFEKFTQFGRTDGAGEKGTGLGLAICRHIVELHAGRIWVESEQGKGSTFHFTLPAYCAERVLNEAIDERLAAAGARRERLFLVLLDTTPVGPYDEEEWDLAFRRMFASLAGKGLLARESDYVSLRGAGRVVVLADIDERHVASVTARWKAGLVKAAEDDPGSPVLRASVGTARFPEEGETTETLLKQAEARLAQDAAVDGKSFDGPAPASPAGQGANQQREGGKT